MKKKCFDHRNWHRTTSDEQHIYNLLDGILVDYLAGEVTKPLVVSSCGVQMTVLDSFHRWIHWAPTGAHHALTVQLDAQDRPIQFYIDINHSNAVSEDGLPYGMDLYLDVVALTEGWQVKTAEIIDGDELEEAISQGRVSPELAEFAWMQARNVHALLLNQAFEDLLVVQKHLKDHPRRVFWEATPTA
ncbi:DUF402 domain-containing protein [Deinococcus cellulosilyticus]|uniref:DUF402 domain-containing protein n=1 Tax=Deinococcus cellulosilyticus (strain DSM 18568 / NBRC 106333 / KACC 11606 / 5516J-15) TaxID=1223518 RepID=A0A511MYQ7_DEIC1|nr:DUF402 domain-containing protein [Deinococcus cellulosilyticus]GEM45277.1 hypothetical protein DC3_09120 [Deinococcus cellulosilyticus NBRC 106333 = KACC 11606]